MNILKEILTRYGSDVFREDIHQLFCGYFQENAGNIFLLNRHSDPGMNERKKVKIKIAKAYSHHVLVDVLNQQDKPLYQTTITYSSLLDRDNTNSQGSYELIKVFTRIAIIREED